MAVVHPGQNPSASCTTLSHSRQNWCRHRGQAYRPSGDSSDAGAALAEAEADFEAAAAAAEVEVEVPEALAGRGAKGNVQAKHFGGKSGVGLRGEGVHASVRGAGPDRPPRAIHSTTRS